LTLFFLTHIHYHYVIPDNHSILTERAMKIEIIVDPTRAAPSASLASRVAPAPNGAPARFVLVVAREPCLTRFCIRLHYYRGGKRGGRGGRPKRAPKTPKTAADLDAEMEVGCFQPSHVLKC
jgi:THO complex subunit 4